jgi:hypothetical protein
MRGHENVAKHPCSAQTGWSTTTQTRIPKHFGKLTTPSAPSEVATRYFLDVASTPPHGGGESSSPIRTQCNSRIEPCRSEGRQHAGERRNRQQYHRNKHKGCRVGRSHTE